MCWSGQKKARKEYFSKNIAFVFQKTDKNQRFDLEEIYPLN